MKFTILSLLLCIAGCVPIVASPDAAPVDDPASGQTIEDGQAMTTTPFDGSWFVQARFEPNQGIAGGISHWLEVGRGRVNCVGVSRTPSCEEITDESVGSRPISNEGGIVIIKYGMRFPACHYSCCDEYDGEETVDVTITGREISQAIGSVFDIVVEQRFVFTGNSLLSVGTMEHFPHFFRDEEHCAQ